MGTTRFFLFYEKGQKPNEKKQAINLVYSISGERKFFRTKIRLFTANWDQANQKAIYIDKKKAKQEAPGIDYDLMVSSKEADRINNVDIGGLRQQIFTLEETFEKDFKLTGKQYTPKMVVDELKRLNKPGRAEVPQKTKVTSIEVPAIKVKTIIDYFQAFIDRNSKTKAAGSMNSYKNVKRFLENYQKKNGKVVFEKITDEFLEDFSYYLNTVEGIRNGTAYKTMKSFKTLLKDAKKKGAPIPESYNDFSSENEESDIIALTMAERDRIYNLDLSKNRRLDEVRDCFIFSCATGFRYSDLERFNRSNIKNGYLEITAKKTKRKVMVPLNPHSEAILNKYKSSPYPIPVISNPKFNKYLKEIGELAKMNESIEIIRHQGNKEIKEYKLKKELLTVHTGRKTFATLHLELGVPMEVVMAWGGWTDYRSFKRYVKIHDERKNNAMALAWAK